MSVFTLDQMIAQARGAAERYGTQLTTLLNRLANVEAESVAI